MKIKDMLRAPFIQNQALIQGSRDLNALTNLAVVHQSSGLGLVITIALCLLTPILIPGWFISIGHLFIMGNYLFFMLLSRHLIKVVNQNVNLIRFITATYTFISLILIAYINTVPYPDKPGTLMASMMILSAALFSFSLLEAFAIFSGILISYICMTFTFKADGVIGEDLFMVISGYFLAVVVFLIVNKLRYKEFMLKSHYIRLSSYDDLTGILAKRPCEDACREYLANREGAGCAMVIIDVDNFKNINDSFGHYQGDMVLKNVGEQLEKVFLDTDIIGRIGGDEFLVLLKDIDNLDLVNKKLHHLRQVVKEAVADQLDIRVSLSLGGVLVNPEPVRFELLYQFADKVMYMNKQGLSGFLVKHIADLMPSNKMILFDCDQEAIEIFNGVSEYECLNPSLWRQAVEIIEQGDDNIKALVLDHHKLTVEHHLMIADLKDSHLGVQVPIVLINAKSHIDKSLESVISHSVDYPLTAKKMEQLIAKLELHEGNS